MEKNLGNLSLELTADQLESVSGGTYTPQQAALLSGYLKMAKQGGTTKEQVLSMVPVLFSSLSSQYPDVTMQEVIDYINANWDKL